MNFAWRIYRWLGRAFPHEFKLAYGEEVTQLGEDIFEDIARRHGAAGLVRLVADIAIRVPLEYLSEMRRDMYFAGRALRKSPGFALVGIISMGLAIGLTTDVYSSRWEMFFRELPGAANAKRLVMFQESAEGDLAATSYYYVEQYREQKSLFSGVAAFKLGVPFNVTYQGNFNARPQRVFGQLVSPDYFSVLGVQPQQGRMLSPALDKPGDTPAVVISDRFWRHHLNSSPDAVGQTLHLNGQLATIVGIAPKDFNGALSLFPAELFVPITAPAALAPELGNDVLQQRSAKELLPIFCLAPNVSIDSAETALDTLTRNLDEQDPSQPKRTDKGRRVTLLLAGTRVPIPRKIKPVLAGFFIALMVLLIALACTNLANMLIARGANRRKELAIRLAVGASRFRLIRQMMAEGILLSLLGGIGGFLLAYGLAALNSHFTTPSVIPIESDFHLDWTAGVFVFVLAVVCGIGFSVAPALQATRSDVAPALKEGSALHLPGYGRFGLRNLLMVAQVAASLMLLLITGFLVLGIIKSSSIQTSFDPKSMYLFSLDPVRDGYSPDKAQALFEKLPAQLKNSSAVRALALSSEPPFSNSVVSTPLTAEDPSGSSHLLPAAGEITIGAGYFATLGESMLAGREFSDQDEQLQPNVSAPSFLPAVLNQHAARKLFGDDYAIGKRLRGKRQSYEVVGVVHDTKDVDGVTESLIYIPFTARDFAHPPAGGITFIVRSDAGSDALAGIRNEIGFLDPNLNMLEVKTLAAYLDQSRATLLFAVQTYGAIGLFGLILAAIGLGGVTAYAVAQRRKEIAIRMAIGASSGRVLRLVLREGAALVIVGGIFGYLGAIVLAKILGSLANMFVDALRFGTNDPRLLLGAPLLLAAVATLACYLPARRSTRIDPLAALREE
jgi:predicted permease